LPLIEKRRAGRKFARLVGGWLTVETVARVQFGPEIQRKTSRVGSYWRLHDFRAGSHDKTAAGLIGEVVVSKNRRVGVITPELHQGARSSARRRDNSVAIEAEGAAMVAERTAAAGTGVARREGHDPRSEERKKVAAFSSMAVRRLMDGEIRNPHRTGARVLAAALWLFL